MRSLPRASLWTCVLGTTFILASQAEAFCVNDPPRRMCLSGSNQPHIVTQQEKAIADRCYDPRFAKSNPARWAEAWKPWVHSVKPYVRECLRRLAKTIDNHPFTAPDNPCVNELVNLCERLIREDEERVQPLHSSVSND